MTAPRAREQRRPPSPPDRRPPRRGGDSSPSTYAASAAGRAAGPARLAPRGLVRSARALAAAALLALTGALFLPPTAEAQTATTLISNTGQGDTATHNYGGTFSQRFTTGSNEDGYTLTGVDVVSASSTGFTAQVCGVDSDLEPTSTCTGLTAPGTFAVGTMSFTAPTNTVLVKETTYAVVVTALATNTPGPDDLWSGVAQGWELTFSNRVDANPAAGWSLSDTGHWKERDPPGSWRTHVAELRIAIKGSAVGGTSSCTLNTGDLWCGVVTVGAITTGGSVAAHGFAGTAGDLDDKTFSVGTNNYTIDSLYVGTSGDLNLELTGALDAADKGNLELVVGSTAFDLDDATHVSAVNGYLWTSTGLNWSSDTHVTLRLRRAVALSTDATLSGLTVYDGSSNLTLSPTFASGTEAYTASAAYDIATVTVTATKNQADATVAWLDASDATLVDADTNAAGRQVALAAGANTFKVKVTAEDGTTTKTYTVTVNRASPSCTPNTGDLWCGVVTVGSLATPGGAAYGYAASVSLGALSDTTFSVGSNNYTITAITHSSRGSLDFDLSSALTAADRAALVVHHSSAEFEFSDAVVSGDRYNWADAGLDWSSESFVTLRLRDTPVTNNAPVFSATSTTRTVAENSAAGTNVGAVIPEATDSDSGDTLTYSMEGTDAASFAFDASTRQITTITGVTYNHEATKNSYSVTVKASDGTASATIAVTIDVTDVNEKSAKPAKPTLAAVTGSSTTLTATWTKPDLDGGPEITGYEVQYREGTTGDWEDFAHTGTAVTTTVTGLTADTSYQVQVRANNGEVLSDWSDASDAVKTNAAAVAPTITAVAVTSTPVLETDTYGAGERIEVTVTFSEAVNATTDTDFVLSVGGTDTRAPVLDGSGTTTLVFSYTVRASDEDDNGIWIGNQDRTLVGDRMGLPQAGAITSVATSTAADLTHSGLGTDADHKVDGSRSIVLVAVSSTPMLETDTYGAGETIRFTVTFSSGVSIGGSPVFRFSLGNLGLGRQVDAAYESGAGSAALVFGYTVVSSDEDDDGIWIGHQGQTLVGTHQTGTITIVATSEAAAGIEHDALGVLSGHKVDGSRTTGNNAPVFTSSASLSVEENTSTATVVAVDNDTDDDITGYAITGGTDQDFFENVTSAGVLSFDEVPNFEDPEDSGTDNTYVVTVQATSGTGTREMTATQTITVTVTDADEKSAKPDKPTLAKVTGSSTSLTATWTKPDLNGGPEITGYAVQYKVNTATTWEDFAHSDTAVTTTVTGLTADTSYQVQVRAKNGETDSDWSDASDAVKTNAEMSTPTCTLNTGDLWCGVVTVALHTVDGSSIGYGFADASVSTNTSDTGALSNKNFTVTTGTIPYTIDGALVGVTFVVFSLTSDLTAADKEKLVLHVDGSSGSFAFSDATGPDTGHSYQWPPSGLDWTSETSVTLRLREANTAPVFADDLAAFTLLENSAADVVVGTVTATDADDDTLTYNLEGTDAGSFAIDSGTGEIKTKTGVTYDYEKMRDHEMTAKADDGNGGTDTIDVAITLLDDDTKSAKPDKPTLAPVPGSSTSLTATWTKPDLNGGTEIGGYDVAYRVGTTGTWELFEHVSSGLTTTITGLTADTSYQARVRAANHEAFSDWSDASDAVKTNAEMSTTTCTLNPGDLWCGVVTVERFVLGVLALDGFGEGEGGLSETEFTYGTNSYTIDIAANEGTNRILLFSLTSALTAGDRAALELHVDGNSASFAFSAATYNSSAHNYTWTGTGLDWFGTSTVTLRLRAATETDATLRALRVTHSDGSVRLSPAFAPETEEYRASVANPVDEVTVAATANVAAAEVAYLDASDTAIPDTDTMTPGREVDLEVGATVVEVKVTAEDGTTMRTYRVTVTRRAPDAPGVEGELRLTETEHYEDPDNDRHGGTAGRAEVFHAGRWGTVCSDGIRKPTFSTFDHDAMGELIMDADGNPTETEQDNEAAALICKDRGYDDGEYREKFSKYRPDAAEADHQDADYWPASRPYSDAATPIWLDELRCVAGEPALGTDPLPGAMSHCSYAGWGLHNCTHKEDAVLRCWNNDAAGPGLKSLKGRFVSPPERHDGTNRVKVRVAFSEPVEESPENVGAHGVEVEGGEVTSVSPVGGDARDGAGTRSAGGRNAGGEDREVVWEFEIEPDSDGDLTVTLEAGRPCGEPGAICTADGRALSEGISTTVEGPEAPPPLTASFGNMPEAHDGTGAFRFRVAFSENIGISYRSLREDAFAVSGGRVTRGRRVDDRRDLFEMTVEPDGDGEVTVTLPAGRECSVSGAICTKGENRRQLTNAPTATVAGPAVETGPAGLTARFVDMPSEHDGETAFKFRIAFSEEIRMSGRRLRSDVVAVSGGRATKAGRVNRRKDLWKLKVRPDSLADVTVTLSSGAACDTPGAVCTADGRALSNTVSATVKGPVAVSVADARAREGEDETIDFAVSLSRAASGRVSVTYATADGTATAGSDYTRASGKLRFAPGETEKTISVPVLDDAHDEGEETFTLRLTASSGAAIADGVATGTIENTDHMPRAWMVRFGRTVGSHVVDALGERLEGGAPSHVTVGGIRLTGAPGAVPEADTDDPFGLPEWATKIHREEAARTLTRDDLLLRSAFHLSSGGGFAAEPAFTTWGRVSMSGFEAEVDDVTMDGDVTTGLIGFDAEWERVLAGVMVSQSKGEGDYRLSAEQGGDAGSVKSSLTGVYPYARLALSGRMSAWALAGAGSGELTLTQEGGKPMPTDIAMRMGAVGVKGQVLDGAGASGVALNVKSDAMWVGTKSERTHDMVATEGDVTRLRLIVEGERSFEVASGATFTPSAQLGVRHDGGDAETGTGVEVGAGLRYTVGAVTIEAQARTLLAHEASGYEEWGMSGAVRVTPGASGRGLTLSIAPAWGQTGSAAERLWSAQKPSALGSDSEFEPESRLEMDVGYGFGLAHGRGVLTPYAGFTLGDAGNRTVRTGARWQLNPDTVLGLEATRQASGAGEADNELMLRIALRF